MDSLSHVAQHLLPFGINTLLASLVGNVELRPGMNRFFENPSPGKPTSTSVESINGKHEDRDAKEMAALGKKQLLKVNA